MSEPDEVEDSEGLESSNSTTLLDSATCDENYRRFIRRAVEADCVWALANESGTAYAESYEYEETDVLLFFSDAAYARRARDQSFPEFERSRIAMFDFLYRWLPGMTRDGHLAGPNWTGDLIGSEVEAYDLREAIENELTPEQQARFREMFNEAAKRSAM